MDVQTLQQELEQLRKEKEEAKQRLDAFRPGANRFGPARDHGSAPYSRDEQQEPGPYDDDHGRVMGSMQQQGPGGRGMGMRGGGRGGVFARLTGGALGRQPSVGRDNGQFAGMGRAERFEHDDRVGNGHDAPFNRSMGMGGPSMGARRSRHHGDHDDRDGRGFRPYRDLDRPQPDFPSTTQAAAPSSSRRKVLSSVIVDKAESKQGEEDRDNQQQDTQQEQEINEEYDPQQNDQHASGSKRPADNPEPAADAPAEAHIRKRNKRMFGALLGTLQRFRNEDAQFQSSEVAAKRDAALRKAEAREKLESERLRRKEADARAAARDEELARLGSLSLAADCKLLELMYASRIARKEKMSHCLVTKAQPAIYWSPAQPNPATKKLLEAQQKELQEWKANLLQELEVEKEGLKSRSDARREAALSRRAARAERIAAARAAGDASSAAVAAQYSKEDEEADRAAQAGEYARPQSNGGEHDEEETNTRNGRGRRRQSASRSASPPLHTDRRVEEQEDDVGAHGKGSPVREHDQANEEEDQEMHEDKEADDIDMGAESRDKDLEAVTVEDLLA